MGVIFWFSVLAALAVWFKSRRRSLPLPPGPPGDPIIGHLRYIPAEAPAETFAEWSKTYGVPPSVPFGEIPLMSISFGRRRNAPPCFQPKHDYLKYG